jgi:CHASE3 domain sensor protein
VTARSIELLEQAVGRQQHLAALYRRMLLVGTLLIVPLLGLLAYLLVRWSHRLF